MKPKIKIQEVVMDSEGMGTPSLCAGILLEATDAQGQNVVFDPILEEGPNFEANTYEDYKAFIERWTENAARLGMDVDVDFVYDDYDFLDDEEAEKS